VTPAVSRRLPPSIITTWRRDRDEQFLEGRRPAGERLRQPRVALDRRGLDIHD
jgi:hypothetical protein